MNIEEPLDDKTAEKVMVTVPNDDIIQHWFTYHPPSPADVETYKRVRDGALAFARIINAECPDGADKSVAIRKVREAVMTTNASIACCGKP